MFASPDIDPTTPLQFVINAAAGSNDADAKRRIIEAALQAAGRQGNLLFSDPANLARVANQAAALAIANGAAVVAVGGDGTLNTVAQAAHALGCPMGVVPQGTFNYFARTHGIPSDPADATRLLLQWSPGPVQVAAINDRVLNSTIWCSDPHFGTEQPQVVEALVMLARLRQPDLLVLSGDITQRATPARSWIVWAHLFFWVSRATTTSRCLVCGPACAAPMPGTAQQIDRVANLLANAAPAQLRVVVVHQPVAVTRAEDAPNLLRGHARPLWAVQAGTAVSSREQAEVPNSVNLLRWGADSAPGCCQIEQWDFSSAECAFVRVRVSEVRPDRS
jgi:hypothetical protein